MLINYGVSQDYKNEMDGDEKFGVCKDALSRLMASRNHLTRA
jgi:hypothetical protein